MNEIITGDCLSVIRSLPSATRFQCVIADPPYNVGKDFGNDSDRQPLDDYVAWCEEWVALCRERLTDGGILHVYGYPEILCRLAARYPPEEQRWAQWFYRNLTVPKSRFWQRSHESILCLWRVGGKRPQLRVEALRQPYSESMKSKISRGSKNVFPQKHLPAISRSRFNLVKGEDMVIKDMGGALPRDVIEMPCLSGGVPNEERWFFCRTCGGAHSHAVIDRHAGHDLFRHPTRKPMRLTRRLIASVCEPNSSDAVLIPFAGSGSECHSARAHGVPWLGVEINPEYAMFARDWLRKTNGLLASGRS